MKEILKSFYLTARTAAFSLAGAGKKRVPLDKTKISKILLIRTDRLGDMVLTTPFVAALKAAFPASNITLLASPGPARLMQFNPHLSATVQWDGSRRGEIVAQLRATAFDLALDLHYDYALETAKLCTAAAAKVSCGFDIAGRGYYFDLPVKPQGAKHFTEELGDILSALGIHIAMKSPELFFDNATTEAADAFLKENGLEAGRYAVVHPGGHYAAQRWPANKFAQLSGFLRETKDLHVMTVGSTDERTLLAQAAPGEPAYSGGDPLMTAALISKAALFIGNNSGPLHMACALNVPNVSTMGPTDPVRFAPLGNRSAVVRKNPVSLITVEDMERAVNEVLE